MTLWWIGNIVLLVVILPVVVYLLRGVLRGGPEHRSLGGGDRRPWRRPGRRTSTPPRCC